ncbi:MAG: ComF family protein [Bacteroidales bacterium]|nr:ComF family protein [Bacteroidales bacterium]
MIRLKNIAADFVSLFYPKLCLACQSALQGNEHILCTSCMNSLPETSYFRDTQQPVMELFNGRLKLEHAGSLLFFEKGSKYRNLIYQLKYKGKKEAGIFLGKLMGARILESRSGSIDCIVPVPLHKSRLRRRGYNQSAILAAGISPMLNIPVVEDVLIRKKHTATQTRKGRFERWQNVEDRFECRKASTLENKHVLLVDDVVTTGATLEAAGSCLLAIPGLTLSVATAAYASS